MRCLKRLGTDKIPDLVLLAGSQFMRHLTEVSVVFPPTSKGVPSGSHLEAEGCGEEELLHKPLLALDITRARRSPGKQEVILLSGEQERHASQLVSGRCGLYMSYVSQEGGGEVFSRNQQLVGDYLPFKMGTQLAKPG